MSTLEVVGAVIHRDGRVLAARRRAGRSMAGKWEFPGGKIEPGETPEAALSRELREELSIDALVGALVGSSTTSIGDRALHLVCYATTVTGSGPASSTDHDALVWLEPAELGSVDWADADSPIVHGLLAGDRTWMSA